MASKSGTKALSKAHKDALAQGRSQSRAVRRYLEALEAQKPKRGRPRTADSIQQQMTKVESQLGEANALDRVLLLQRRIDLKKDLDALDNKVDLSAVEAGFVAVAADYSARRGLTYAAWREAGVPASTLKAAGVRRGA